MRNVIVLVCLMLCGNLLFSSAVDAREEKQTRSRKKREAPAKEAPAIAPAAQEAQSPPVAAGPPGTVNIDVTNVTGDNLPSRVDFIALKGDSSVTVEVPTGRLQTQAPSGATRAYVYVYDDGVPVLVDIQDITLTPEKASFVLVNLLEGAGGRLSVRDFDFDGDLAIDSVELKAGTNREDASSVPGRAPVERDMRILQDEMRWYRGELFARSRHGIGSESVGEIIRRAEKAGLDFLAIADRNTMDSTKDPEYKSDKLVLIPAMEWGNDQKGYALIYAPGTLPDPPTTSDRAQAECIRVQAQGGIFAVAHPCLSTSPWLWGLSYVNAVNVWYGPWSQGSPLRLSQLSEDLRARDKGRLVHSIAAAARQADLDPLPPNAQAALFWDYESNRGLIAAAIGGSGANNAKVPLGRPMTYIKAKTKSLPGLMEGLRLGYTYVTSGADGPNLLFQADVLNDGKIDVSIGGTIPAGALSMLHAGVRGAAGKKLQVLQDGRPILSKNIEGDPFGAYFPVTPTGYSVFRLRVIAPDPKGKAPSASPEVLALSSPIYAQDITMELLQQTPNLDIDKLWVRYQPKPDEDIIGPPEDVLRAVDEGRAVPREVPGTP